MEIHNISEDRVFDSVKNIFEAIKNEGNPNKFCLCEQCKLDTICFALNRIEPRYIVSNRGITRMDQDWSGRMQNDADIASLIYRGLRQVNHNLRPNALHDDAVKIGEAEHGPSFKIPTIVGRIFDGGTFAPVEGAVVELRREGELVSMRNTNWQNPFTLVANTPGIFSFWPNPIHADAVEEANILEYTLKIESPQYETLTQFFKVPVVSNIDDSYSFCPDKTFKIPDLYLFPPGEGEING